MTMHEIAVQNFERDNKIKWGNTRNMMSIIFNEDFPPTCTTREQITLKGNVCEVLMLGASGVIWDMWGEYAMPS